MVNCCCCSAAALGSADGAVDGSGGADGTDAADVRRPHLSAHSVHCWK